MSKAYSRLTPPQWRLYEAMHYDELEGCRTTINCLKNTGHQKEHRDSLIAAVLVLARA